MLKESDILFELGNHWIMLNKEKKAYEIYKIGLTNSTKVATIGQSLGGADGINRAIEECKRREGAK